MTTCAGIRKDGLSSIAVMLPRRQCNQEGIATRLHGAIHLTKKYRLGCQSSWMGIQVYSMCNDYNVAHHPEQHKNGHCLQPSVTISCSDKMADLCLTSSSAKYTCSELY